MRVIIIILIILIITYITINNLIFPYISDKIKLNIGKISRHIHIIQNHLVISNN
jgi:hypothetical protein